MTTTPAPTDHDASVPTLAISDLIPVVEAELRAERDAAREELAKTSAQLATMTERHSKVRKLAAEREAELIYLRAESTTWKRKAVRLRDELGNAKARISAAATVQVWTNEDGERFVFADDLMDALDPNPEANPATTDEPTTLPLLPDIAHLTTPLPDDDDAPPMAVGIIPNCARCDAPMFVGHRCPAEPATEPKATCGIECTELPLGTHPLGGMHIGTCALPPGHDGTHDPDAAG